MDAAVVTVLSELDGMFAFKEEQRVAPRLFGEIFALLPTGFGKRFVKHCGTS